MTTDLEARLAALESRLKARPDSRSLRRDLLLAFLEDWALYGDPRRIEHIHWFVRTHPRDVVCRSPMVAIAAEMAPDAYRAIKAEWLRIVAENPRDANVARGIAAYIAAEDLSCAIEILERITQSDPDQAEVWLDLGCMSQDPSVRLRHFTEAQRGDSTLRNLLAWIALTAVRCSDFATAEATANTLLARVDAARALHGERLEWIEGGAAFFARALSVTGTHEAARDLVEAREDYADDKHAGYRVLGLVALHRGDMDAAVACLHDAAAVPDSTRLGASFDLARELCLRRRWSEVDAYLQTCEAFLPDENTSVWRTAIVQRRLPEFPED